MSEDYELQEMLERMNDEIDELTKERDHYMALVEGWEERWDRLICLYEEMTQERDKWKEMADIADDDLNRMEMRAAQYRKAIVDAPHGEECATWRDPIIESARNPDDCDCWKSKALSDA